MTFKIGQIPWNKGIPQSKEAKEKNRLAHLGTKTSEGTKKKMSIAHKKNSVKAWLGKKGYWDGKKRPEISGKNHYNWKGGVNRQVGKDLEYRTWRAAVFERDDYTCQTCGKRGCYLEAHHIKRWIDFPKLRFELDNGLTECNPCHNIIHRVGV